MSGKKVFVGLSGGVDSSVSALRLKRQGYDVTGVFIKVWHPDFLVCNWETERLDAMRVAAKLDIPFLTCDSEEAYKNEVADYFIKEYLEGRTPNPDVMCNKSVKFGNFLNFARDRGADYIATGHYAQIQTAGGVQRLLRGVDSEKDQSYFLWTLNEEQLNKVLFPIGDSHKTEIRKEAMENGLVTASKKDSQGICFLGHVDIKEFLGHYVKLVPGNVISDTGEIIGKHDGALIYTTGQRHGFTVSNHQTHNQIFYVVDRDIRKNTITVSETKKFVQANDTIELTDLVLRESVTVNKTYDAQFRYRQKPFSVQISSVVDNSMTITLGGEVEKPAVGQSCVLYRENICVGGGIIS